MILSSQSGAIESTVFLSSNPLFIPCFQPKGVIDSSSRDEILNDVADADAQDADYAYIQYEYNKTLPADALFYCFGFDLTSKSELPF